MYCHVFAFEIERLQATAIKGTDKKNIENLNFQNIINAKFHIFVMLILNLTFK
jgi:hypothetical protein